MDVCFFSFCLQTYFVRRLQTFVFVSAVASFTVHNVSATILAHTRSPRYLQNVREPLYYSGYNDCAVNTSMLQRLKWLNRNTIWLYIFDYQYLETIITCFEMLD